MSSEKTLNDWERKFQDNGYRLTTPRREIIRVVAESLKPLSPMEIFDIARQSIPTIGLVTVYRTIEKMESLKLIHRVHHINQCQTIFRSTQDHQHLLICTKCGKTEYFEGLDVEHAFEALSQKYEIEITGHSFQLFGICKTCANKPDKEQPSQ